jgi:hypothetical protein
MTNIDMMALYHQPKEKLIQWYAMLNCWGWPEGLPDPEPPINRNVRFTRRGKIMRWIRNKVGQRAILYNHNFKRMSYFEFKDFWEAWHENNEVARRRYQKRSLLKSCLKHTPKPSVNYKFLYKP